MGEIKIWTISILVTTFLCYVPASFAMWDWNPGNWAEGSRVFVAGLWVIGILFIGGFPGWRDS